MYIHVYGSNPPAGSFIAVSGGMDSMVLLNFYLQHSWRVENLRLCYFHHGTEHGDDARRFLISEAARLNLELHIGFYQGKGTTEAAWRNGRYEFFESLPGDVIMAHHLRDAMETWLMTSFKGKPRLIPASRPKKSGTGKYWRPFITVRHSKIEEWADKFCVRHITDPSNSNLRYTRNRVRHTVLPRVLECHPGFATTIRNMYLHERS